MITVGELKKRLARLSDDLPIVMGSDAEGNEYSPLADIQKMAYEGAGRGIEVYDPDDGEEYDLDETLPCVVLWRV